MGFTLAVGDLAKGHSLIGEKTKGEFRTYDGVYGKSFLVPPEIASGVWMEMAQSGLPAR